MIFSRNGHLIQVCCGSKFLWAPYCMERGVLCANTDVTAHAITTGVASTPLVLPSRSGTSAFRPALFFSFVFFWLANQVCCTLKATQRSCVCVCLPWCPTCSLESICAARLVKTNMSGRALWCVSVLATTMCDEQVRHFTYQIGRCVFAIASVHTRFKAKLVFRRI